MATHSLYPPLTSFASYKPFIFPRLSIIRFPLQRRFTLRASSIKKPRVRRKVKSDQELCNDIREFVSAVGLPVGHVPSMKELSLHGRTDLANIVRRRGYKRIKDLLSSATETDTNVSDVGESLTDSQDATNEYEDASAGQDDKEEDLVKDVLLSSKGAIMESHIIKANIDPAISYNEQSCIIESSTHPSFQEKVAKFIQNGELDTIEDNDHDILNGAAAEEGKRVNDSENTTGLESGPLAEVHIDNAPSGSNGAKILNGSVLNSDQNVLPVTSPLGDDQFTGVEQGQGLVRADFDKDLGIETSEGECQDEVSCLKLMLHQKELELSELKKEIEKEKLALTILQTKAETEISKAQKLILEKDAELTATEESLAGLKEVQIQFSGDGEIVEVAGSFNGWHHWIKMDPQPSSSSKEPVVSRLWSTVLWLYPGLYEIKFIIDGQWRIDPQREIVTRGTIHNNILRVDR